MILPGMDQDVLDMCIERPDDPAQLDHLRSSPDNGHDLQRGHSLDPFFMMLPILLSQELRSIPQISIVDHETVFREKCSRADQIENFIAGTVLFL
jgi:hypothetical protein